MLAFTWRFALIVLITSGCAVKPKTTVAAGQDHDLFRKDELLGRPLSDVATADLTMAGKQRLRTALPDSLSTLVKDLAGKDSDALRFDISESYVTISRDQDGHPLPLRQYQILGHFDLTPQKNPDGVETQYLARDTAAHGRWQDRAFVEIDPFQALAIKADDDTMRDLYAVDALRGQVRLFVGPETLTWLNPADRSDLIARFSLKNGDNIQTTLTRTSFSIYLQNADGTMTLLAQADVQYFNLIRSKNDKNEETDKVIRDDRQTPWTERLFVEIDPAKMVLVKPSADLMRNLFEKAAFAGKSFKVGSDPLPLVALDSTLLPRLQASAIAPLQNGDALSFAINEKSLDVLANGRLIAKYAVIGHVDIAPSLNRDGEPTAELAKNTDKSWNLRRYVEIDPFTAELVYLSSQLLEDQHSVIAKSLLKNQCYKLAELPIATVSVADAVKSLGITLSADDALCFELAQTVLSVFKGSGPQRSLLLTFDIEKQVDIDNLRNDVGDETLTVIAPTTRQPNWEDRAYIVISASTPHAAEDHTGPNALARSVFDGEFIYTATVVAAHSENGLVFDGLNLQSTDRLSFEISENALTAYKINETLNDSRAKSPVLRYTLDTFDIARRKNSFGDATEALEETHDAPWQARSKLRVDFATNEILSYFNDLLGIEKNYLGTVFAARSRLASDIKVEDGMISFETEEVLTPNALAGFTGSGETQMQPFAVRIKHAFLRVGQRSYASKLFDELDFRKFGFFRVTEFGIDPEKGKTDDALKQYIRRYDLAGDQHITYHLSPDFPEAYKLTAREVIAAWNVAFKAAVGRDDVMILDETSTSDIGDPRLNMLVYIANRNDQSPLGFGPSVFDPTTGENISGKAFLYGDGVQQVLRMAGDYFDASGRTLGPIPATTAGAAGSVVSTPLSPGSIVQALPRRTTEVRAAVARAVGGSANRLADAFAKIERNASVASDLLQAEPTSDLRTVATSYKTKENREAKLSFGARNEGCVLSPEYHLASAIKFIDAHPGKTRAELLAELESRMVFTTLLHEVGHNLGLRHNFQGSFDESNYPAQYHALKAQQAAGDAAVEAPGEWLEKYRGSSVMDYSDDFEALYKAAGPYDVAAIKFGYGDKLERIVGTDANGSFLTEDMQAAAFEQARSAISAANPGLSADAADLSAVATLNIRPYKFCTDEQVENDPTCQRFDRGTTLTETTQALVDDYDVIYKLYAARRTRTFTGNSQYVLSRFIMPVRQLLDEYVYQTVQGHFADTGAGSQDDFINAISVGVTFYKHILDTLEPGDYHLDATTGDLVAGRSADADAKNLVVDANHGRYLETQLEHVGTIDRPAIRGIQLDKIGVLWAMTMRGFPAEKYDRAQISVNYYDLLHDFTLTTFSALMRDDYKIDLLAKRDASGNFVPVLDDSLDFDPADPTLLKAKIKPGTNLTVQHYAGLLASLDFNSSSDRTFGDYLDLRVQGIDATFQPDVQTTSFRSASGQRTYVVPNTADHLGISFAIAKMAATTDAKRVALVAQKAALPDATALRTHAIAAFADAWAIGNAEAMPDSVRTILDGNFGPNIPVIRFFLDTWLAGVDSSTGSDDSKTKLELAVATLQPLLAAFEDLDKQTATIDDAIKDSEHQLTQNESLLIDLRGYYAAFN